MVKKKILFVIDSLTSGGAEKSLVSLLTLIDYNNYEVDLLMFSPQGLYLPLLPKEVNVVEAPIFVRNQLSGIRGLLRNKDFKGLYIRIAKSISLRIPYKKRNLHGAQFNWKWLSKGISQLDKRYDVAVAYSQGMPTYYVAEKVNAAKKFSWVNTDYKSAAYNKDFDIHFYRKIHNVVAVSDPCKDVLINEIPSLKSKVTIIYDIISPKLVKTMSQENGGFADKYQGLRILTIGRLVNLKGYDMAIEACYKLIKEGYDLKWYVIGEGELQYELENRVREYGLQDIFVFLGTHHNPYTYLDQCDIYVQPSRFEGFGMAIAEAKILEKPVVATNFTVVHNQIKDRENGLIVGMNSEEIYKGIRNMIEDSALRNHICVNLEKEDVGTEGEISKLYSLIKSS